MEALWDEQQERQPFPTTMAKSPYPYKNDEDGTQAWCHINLRSPRAPPDIALVPHRLNRRQSPFLVPSPVDDEDTTRNACGENLSMASFVQIFLHSKCDRGAAHVTPFYGSVVGIFRFGTGAGLNTNGYMRVRCPSKPRCSLTSKLA